MLKNRYRNKDGHQRRKLSADARKEAYDKLTVQQKLDRGPGAKELLKLELQLKKTKKLSLSAEALAELEGDAVVFASNPKHLKKN